MDVKNITYNYPSPVVEIWRLRTEKQIVTRTETRTYTTEGKDVEKYLDVWRSWIGYSEENGKFKQIIDIYNSYKPKPTETINYEVKYDDEWCDATVSAAAIQAGMVDIIGIECGCERHMNNIFKPKGIWIGKTQDPKPGDIILYGKNGVGRAYHIGVVETNNGNGTVTIINGNSQGSGKSQGGKSPCVARWTHSINYKEIVGYARPRYSGSEEREETVTTTQEENVVSGVELIHTFSPDTDRALQSYSWQLSKDNVDGSFSITLYPESVDNDRVCLFDLIQKRDVVKIYEASGVYQKKPSFVGFIKRKRYVSQASGSNNSRRINISGISLVGLVSDFYLNLDTNASILTDQMANEEFLRRDLTISLNTSPGKYLTIQSVINTLWKKFMNLSHAYGTPIIGLYLSEFTKGTDGKSEIFNIDDSTFKYNLGCVFDGNSTQNFFSLVDKIIPNPVYEKFAYTDENGVPHIKIRQVPFPYNDSGKLEHAKWDELVKDAKKIAPKQLTAFSVSDTDDEAYTVFFGYLSGYPISEDKALRLSYISHEGMKDSSLVTSERYAVYGYRPLNAHFIGYGKKDGENDDGSALAGLSAQLKDWYADLPDMLKGDMTIAMSSEDKLIMPGDLVSFAGGYFYVDAINHSWTYNSSGSINISVSRGGVYEDGKFTPFKNISDIQNLIESKGKKEGEK